MHQQEYNTECGNSHFYRNKQSVADFHQSHHEEVDLIGASIEQNQGEQGVQATHQQDCNTDEDQAWVIPIQIVIVSVSAGVASATSSLETTVGDCLPTVQAAVMLFSALGRGRCGHAGCRAVSTMTHFVIFSIHWLLS